MSKERKGEGRATEFYCEGIAIKTAVGDKGERFAGGNHPLTGEGTVVIENSKEKLGSAWNGLSIGKEGGRGGGR